MVAQDRRSGRGSWIPGLLATFWLILAGVSGAYLFYVVTDPDARLQKALASPVATPDPKSGGKLPAEGVSAEEAAALTDAIEAKEKEIAKLKSELKHLSSEVAAFDGRLKPIEKVLGPVAALPRSTSVTTSPPAGTPPHESAAAAPAPAPVEGAPEPPPPPAAEAAPEPAAPEAAATPEPAEPAAAPDVEERTLADVEASQPPVPAQNPMPRTAAPAAEAEPEPAGAPAETELAAVPEAAASEDQTAEPPSPDETAAEAPAADAEGPSEIAALVAPDIPPGTTRFGIELGSVEKQEGVRPMWRSLLTNHAALVAGLQARRIIAPDKKWRLIAGPFSSAAEAMQACTLFKKANMPCEATVFAGDAL